VIDRLLLAGLLATIFLLPTLFGSISIVLALVLSLIAGLRFSLSSKLRQAFDWQPTLTALFAVFLTLGLLFALNADEIGDMSFLVSFLGLAFPILLYQYLTSLARPPRLVKVAAYCLLGCLLGLLFALAQRYGLGIRRTVSVAAGANAVARVAALLGFLALIGLGQNLLSKRTLLAMAPIAAIGIVVLSGSRGTLLAIPVMLLVALVFALPAMWVKSRSLTAFSLVAISILAFGLVTIDPNGFVSRSMSTVSKLAAGQLPGNSAALRYEMLVGAWNAFQQSPILGHGWAGHWEALMQSHPTPEIFAPVKQHFSYHNDVADFAVAGGAFGVLAYFVLLLVPVVNLIADQKLRHNRAVAYALVLIPIAYAIFGLTDFVFGFDLLTTLYGFSLAFVLAAAKTSPH